jgi:hypothetical protein
MKEHPVCRENLSPELEQRIDAALKALNVGDVQCEEYKQLHRDIRKAMLKLHPDKTSECPETFLAAGVAKDAIDKASEKCPA